jgi:hypothetical protein
MASKRRAGTVATGEGELRWSHRSRISKSSSLERLKSGVSLILATMFDMGWSINTGAKAFQVLATR